MRELNTNEVSQVAGAEGMTGQCIVEGALNMAGTGLALGATIASGGLAGAGAFVGSALGWSSWYRDCGPSANYGRGGGGGSGTGAGSGETHVEVDGVVYYVI